MRYIPGNSFLNNTSRHGKYLKRGVIYTIKIIRPNRDNDKITYIFNTTNGDKEITFDTAKQADEFLDNYAI